MKLKKTVTNRYQVRCTTYHLPDGHLHREDGPAIYEEFQNGGTFFAWWYNGFIHRYGAPAVKYGNGNVEYWVHGLLVTDKVEKWLDENCNDSKNMSDIEKWELDLFMRSLG